MRVITFVLVVVVLLFAWDAYVASILSETTYGPSLLQSLLTERETQDGAIAALWVISGLAMIILVGRSRWAGFAVIAFVLLGWYTLTIGIPNQPQVQCPW